jgi:hypothetical protein
MKLIIQKTKQNKKHPIQEKHKFQSFSKSSGVISQASNPDIGIQWEL